MIEVKYWIKMVLYLVFLIGYAAILFTQIFPDPTIVGIFMLLGWFIVAGYEPKEDTPQKTLGEYV